MRHGVEHRPVARWQADVQAIGVVGRHLQDDDAPIARTRLLLAEAKPAHLVVSVQKVRPVGRPIADFLAHYGARGISTALARLEHLHGRANEIAYRINIGDGRPQLLVDDHGAAVVDGDAERLDRQPRPRPFAKRLKHEVRRDFELTRGGISDNPGDSALSIPEYGGHRRAFENLYSLLSHPVDGVGAGFAIANQLKKAVADQHDHATTSGIEKTTIFHCCLAAPDDHYGLARLAGERLDQSLVVVDAMEIAAERIEANRLGAKGQDQGARPKNLAGRLNGVSVEDSGRCVQHELDVELLLALVVHDGMRPSSATPEKVDHFLDRRRSSRHVRKPEGSRE